jgi:hypothetical protein
MPQFFARSGEEIAVPEAFAPATQALTAAVNCVGCTSSHYLRPAQPAAAGQQAGPNHSKWARTADEDVPDHLDPTLAVTAR